MAVNGRSDWQTCNHNVNVDDGELRLTHEFLGIMLGVRRPGVTVALQGLEHTGLISNKRGVITILDREALQTHSNGTYFPPNDK